MKINISANKIDVTPHKVSKSPDLPTISERHEAEFGDITRPQTRRLWMRHARMTGETSIMYVNPVEAQHQWVRLQTGLSMLQAMNAQLRGGS